MLCSRVWCNVHGYFLSQENRRHLNSWKLEKQTNRQKRNKPTPWCHGALLGFGSNRFLCKKKLMSFLGKSIWSEREGIIQKPEQRRWRRRNIRTQRNFRAVSYPLVVWSELPLTEFTLSYLRDKRFCTNIWVLKGQGVLLLESLDSCLPNYCCLTTLFSSHTERERTDWST